MATRHWSAIGQLTNDIIIRIYTEFVKSKTWISTVTLRNIAVGLQKNVLSDTDQLFSGAPETLVSMNEQTAVWPGRVLSLHCCSCFSHAYACCCCRENLWRHFVRHNTKCPRIDILHGDLHARFGISAHSSVGCMNDNLDMRV